VVAPLAGPGALAAARGLDMLERCDLLELRLDGFVPDGIGALEGFLRSPGRALPPLILTVRHPAEGGEGDLADADRARLFLDFLPWGSAVDVETRSLETLRGVVGAARAAGLALVVSRHDFHGCPGLDDLRADLGAAVAAGASAFKVAATPGSVDEALELAAFCAAPGAAVPVAAMGMGPFGRRARLACLAAGSVLNYGYLARPNAPGQWPVPLLKQLLADLDGGEC
jgi:3-dehydroquinate dehydratase-1